MAKDIIFVGGSKGGVGKSMVSTALVDYLMSRGDKVHLIETDTSNADVYKSHKETLDFDMFNLDESAGWVEMINRLSEHPDKTFVINSAARVINGVEEHGSLLMQSVDELERRVLTFWVINPQRDSLELLTNYMPVMNKSVIHVFKNSFFGPAEDFVLFNESGLLPRIEKTGGRDFLFPEVARRVANQMNIRRYSIDKGLKEMPLGNRVELERWRKRCAEVFEEALK
jgi:hypothetical protein